MVEAGYCYRALGKLVHLRKNETLPALAAGFGVPTATARRYADETPEVLAARAGPRDNAYHDLTGGT